MDKFSRLKKMMGSKPKKAMSELEASKDPMGFIEKNKNPSIKGLRGVAFARGGLVRKNVR